MIFRSARGDTITYIFLTPWVFVRKTFLPYENKEKSGLFRSIFYLRKRRTPDRGESGPGQPDWESFCSDPRCPARNIYTEDCSFKI